MCVCILKRGVLKKMTERYSKFGILSPYQQGYEVTDMLGQRTVWILPKDECVSPQQAGQALAG